MSKHLLLGAFTLLFTAACASSPEEPDSTNSDSPAAAPAEKAASGATNDAASTGSSTQNTFAAPLPDSDSDAGTIATAPSDPAAPTDPTTPADPTPADPTPAPAANTSLRGANLVGMEGRYSFSHANGPAPNTDYPVHSTAVVDYLASKHVNVLRFLFSWERMQSQLNGPIPAATTGNYKSYFDDYKRIVDYATNEKGMTVIIEPWQASSTGGVGGAAWRGNVIGNGVVTAAHFADFWGKMAAVYANNSHVAIGLVNEPNSLSTMVWFGAAQSAVTAIRDAGFTGEIHVPGNGWTNGSNWNDSWYDTAVPQRSNAYGWANANGTGKPLADKLNKLVASVHSYADTDASGSTATVVSGSITRSRLTGVVDWARANNLKVMIGEIGMYAGSANASANWSDFVSYLDANKDVMHGFAWWGCGKPGWWDDVAASGGGHFSITPTGNYSGDTVNMAMISSAFAQ